MIASERKRYILKSLKQKGIVNLKEIAKELGISEITARRDFVKLEEEGKLKRVQGGAALEDVLNNAELTMHEKLTVNQEAKIAAAKKAAEFIKDGDSVFLDGGTSVAFIVDYISQMDIKIVTYSALVTRKLTKPSAEVFFIGGRFLPYYSMNIGSVAQNMLRQFHFDVAIFGCTSLDFSYGAAFTSEMESCSMKQIALANSEKSILLCDGTKLEKRSFAQFASLSQFQAIICGNAPKPLPENAPENFVLV